MGDQNSGFTLIELVAVIVILGALSVVALPRFINLQDEAKETALKGVRGAAATAHATNLAAAVGGDSGARSIDQCSETAKLMQGDVEGYTFKGGGSSKNQLGAEMLCFVEQDSTGNTSTTFTGFTVP